MALSLIEIKSENGCEYPQQGRLQLLQAIFFCNEFDFRHWDLQSPRSPTANTFYGVQGAKKLCGPQFTLTQDRIQQLPHHALSAVVYHLK